MNFDYFTVQTVMANIEIEDIGNCAIEANNDNGEFWYLIIRTTLGSTQIFEYGPTIHTGIMEKSVNCSLVSANSSDTLSNFSSRSLNFWSIASLFSSLDF